MSTEKISRIGKAEHYNKALLAKIERFGASIDELVEREAAIPRRRADLAMRILAGDVTGAKRVSEEEEINRDHAAIETDWCKLYHEKETFSEAMSKADREQAGRDEEAAEKRRGEMDGQLSGIGRPVDRETLIRKDTVYTRHIAQARELRLKATRKPQTVEDRQWFDGFVIRTQATFGIPVGDVRGPRHTEQVLGASEAKIVN
jgi:hypothetical protein